MRSDGKLGRRRPRIPQVAFDLAHSLQVAGERTQAAERYRQVIETHTDHLDAWNSLGVVLTELDGPHEACEAFRRVLALDPRNVMAIYNLADTLDELRDVVAAAEQWRAYLRLDTASERATYARRRCLGA